MWRSTATQQGGLHRWICVSMAGRVRKPSAVIRAGEDPLGRSRRVAANDKRRAAAAAVAARCCFVLPHATGRTMCMLSSHFRILDQSISVSSCSAAMERRSKSVRSGTIGFTGMQRPLQQCGTITMRSGLTTSRTIPWCYLLPSTNLPDVRKAMPLSRM